MNSKLLIAIVLVLACCFVSESSAQYYGWPSYSSLYGGYNSYYGNNLYGSYGTYGAYGYPSYYGGYSYYGKRSAGFGPSQQQQQQQPQQ